MMPAGPSMSQEVQSVALKTAPAVGVITAQTAGFGLQEWVFIATLIYLAMQGLYLLWRFFTEVRRERRAEQRRPPGRQPQDE